MALLIRANPDKVEDFGDKDLPIFTFGARSLRRRDLRSPSAPIRNGGAVKMMETDG
jgi:hypothetical protein